MPTDLEKYLAEATERMDAAATGNNATDGRYFSRQFATMADVEPLLEILGVFANVLPVFHIPGCQCRICHGWEQIHRIAREARSK